MSIVWVLSCLPVAALALLFVPMDFVASAGTARRFRLRLRWILGITLNAGSRGRSRTKRAAKSSRGHHRRPGTLRGLRTAGRLLAIDGLATRTARLARELTRAFRWRGGFVSVRAGLGDPADTGELCGVVWSVLAGLPRSSIVFVPDFEALRFEAYVKGAGRVVPARAFLAFARFGVSRPGRQAIRVMLWARGR